MENIKHTAAAGLAVVMIGSLAAFQTADITYVRADNMQTSNYTLSVENWDSSLINKGLKISYSHEEPDAISPDTTDEAAVSAQEQSNIGYVILSEGSLNVRSDSSTEAEVIDQLSCGEQVTIIEEFPEWYKVAYGTEAKEGFVAKASITFSEEEAKAALLKSFVYETGTAVVSEGALNIRAGAGTDYQVVSQLDNGEEVVILGSENDWYKVYYGRNYDEGYVIAESIQVSGTVSRDEVAEKKSERIANSAKSKGVISISSGALNIRSAPDEGASVIAQLNNKTNILVLGTSSGWTKIAFGDSNTVGYAKSEYIKDASTLSSRSSTSRITKTSSASSNTSSEQTASSGSSSYSSSTGQAIVAEAEKYLGTKYVYGGASPSGFDCSGLVQYVCRKVGVSVGRSSRDQFQNGVAVSKDDLQPGDLVFFKSGGRISHVGIYAGNGQMIHSPQTGKTVTYSSINTVSRTRSYAGARRVAN